MTSPVVVGLDNGGTSNNATVLTLDGRFLVDGLAESPSRVEEGPEVAVPALVSAFHAVLVQAGVPEDTVFAVGLDTPGPASSEGTICEAGSTNFSHPAWHGFDVRHALQDALRIPVIYNNDANAAALYAHHVHFGFRAMETSSVSVIVGTGLGGGIVHQGRIIKGASGMAGELGHVPLPLEGVLEDGQPTPRCNCGQLGDAESVASLMGISKNLLPYWLTRFPGHALGHLDLKDAAHQLRSYGERRDPMALAIFDQQAKAIGRLLTIAANFMDPDAYLIGGGLVQAQTEFRHWLLGRIQHHTTLRPEQERIVAFAVVPDLDMAGARGSALAALALVPGGTAFQPDE
jgi:predicted NBD/HSP70 family sugar kinase